MTLLQHYPDGHVMKTMSGSASVPAVSAPTRRGDLDTYVTLLRDAGVRLPEDLTVTMAGPRPAVQHQWLAGSPLNRLAATHPDAFLTHAQQVAAWAAALDPTPARLDTNLANFVLPPAGLTCIDVLPPLLIALRPPPQDAWDHLFGALCYDTDIILCALAGYAARTLLAAPKPPLPAAARRLALCPGHTEPDTLAARWFHARGQAALAALDGAQPVQSVLAKFAATSMLRLRNTPRHARGNLITAGLAELEAAA